MTFTTYAVAWPSAIPVDEGPCLSLAQVVEE